MSCSSQQAGLRISSGRQAVGAGARKAPVSPRPVAGASWSTTNSGNASLNDGRVTAGVTGKEFEEGDHVEVVDAGVNSGGNDQAGDSVDLHDETGYIGDGGNGDLKNEVAK